MKVKLETKCGMTQNLMSGYGVKTKRKVKMAGYWPSLVNKGFIIRDKTP